MLFNSFFLRALFNSSFLFIGLSVAKPIRRKCVVVGHELFFTFVGIGALFYYFSTTLDYVSGLEFKIR
jgi:hypothetical protein